MDRKSVIIIFLLLVSSLAGAQYRSGEAYSGLYDSETVSSFKKHIGFAASAVNEGRKAGSEGEKNTARYLYDILSGYGVDMLSPKEGETFGITLPSGDTLTSRNVVGFIQGYDPEMRDRYIVVGARMDNLGTHTVTVDGRPLEQIYYGANGNASGMAMLAELARMVSTNSVLFRRSVIFIGFGASAERYAGAWYFLNRSFSDADKIDAMINLDMLGTGDDGFYAYTASNTDLDKFIYDLAAGLQPVQPELVAYEPYPSDHRAFYSKEIPAVYFTSGQYSQHNTDKDTEAVIDYEMMERELEYIYNFTITVANSSGSISFRPDDLPVKDAPRYDNDVVSYNDCDYRPMFLNSSDPRLFMQKWVYQYIRYPAKAVQDGIQGTVQVGFIVEKDGKVTDVKVVKGVHPLLDDEAVRVVAASPKWRPGRVRGVKVRTAMTIPVEFRLEKKSSKKKFGINDYNITR